MTNRLPPAPEGFAWMPCSDFPSRTVVGKGDAAAIRSPTSGCWEHCAGPWETVTPDVCRLMRRLGSSERPWGGCRGFRAETGMWFIRNPLSESWPQLTWYAPVRFPRDHVPGFGGRGLRYLDISEDRRECQWLEVHPGIKSPVTSITLPPLPILDQMCAEKPGLREGIDEEAQRLVDDEANRYISGLKVEPMTERSDEIDALRAQLAELAPAEDNRRLSWCGQVGRTHEFDCGACQKCGVMALRHRNPIGDESRLARAAHRAEESERQALIELDYLRSEFEKATQEQGEAQAGWLRATEKMLLGAKENERLIAELASVTVERDALDDAAITALSGDVCTPVDGYAKAGANWLKRDIEELVAQRDEARKAIDEHRSRLQGFRKSLNSLDVTSPLDAREFAALHKIIEALTPE